MAGTVVINLLMALIGFILAYIFSITNNGFLTTMIRGIIAFVIFFLIAYIFRAVLAYVLKNKENDF